MVVFAKDRTSVSLLASGAVKHQIIGEKISVKKDFYDFLLIFIFKAS
jgi:hypothetical protein